MKQVSLEELLEAGCHFGHQVTRQNPKARDYIYEAREGVHIIDLEKTKEGLDEACEFIQSIASKPDSNMLILGAKKQGQEVIKELLEDPKFSNLTNLFTVTNRWIGGTFTNFEEVAKNYKKLKEIEDLLNNQSEKAKYTKKELLMLKRQLDKLKIFYDGVKNMNKLPDCIFIIDTHKEHLAVVESRNLKVPVVGITDTNADPTFVGYPIPANDDAVGSIRLVTSYILESWMLGKQKAAKQVEADIKKDKKDAEKSSASDPKPKNN